MILHNGKDRWEYVNYWFLQRKAVSEERTLYNERYMSDESNAQDFDFKQRS
jgi:hypothetical protein